MCAVNTSAPAPRGGWGSTRRCDHNQVALVAHKRGRTCVIAKLVFARPLQQFVLAMPYRNRQEVNHVSLPPSALRLAREKGAHLWVVRFDRSGECFALALADVEKVGWLWVSDGRPEWFAKLSAFQLIPWQSWDYVERTIVLDEQCPGRQLELFREPVQ